MSRPNRGGQRVALLAAALALAPAVAQAGAVIQYGNTLLGVNDGGELNFNGFHPAGGSSVYGVYRIGVGDAISPGCPCEGWGVSTSYDFGGSTSLTSGFLNRSAGNGGLTGGTFGSTSSTAISTIGLSGAPVQITHQFGGSLASDVFQVNVTITNTGTGTANDIVYRRAMDWDVPPTEFSEFVTHSGVAANLESAGGNVRYASNNGFASSNPLSAAGTTGPEFIGNASVNQDFVDLGAADHGSVFDFAFGSLAAGESRSFNIFYGSAANESQALAKLNQLGVDLYSLGQSSINVGTGPRLDETTGLPLFTETGSGHSVVVVDGAAVDPESGFRLFTRPGDGFSDSAFVNAGGLAVERFNGLALASDKVAGDVYYDPATGEVLRRNGYFPGGGGSEVATLAIGTDGATYVPILTDGAGNRYYQDPFGDVYQYVFYDYDGEGEGTDGYYYEVYLGNVNGGTPEAEALATLVAGLTPLALGPDTTLFDLSGYAPADIGGLEPQTVEVLAANNNAATFIFAFGGVGGVELGTTQDNPILPFVEENPDAVVFEFPAPQPRRWYDPPFADGFTYELVGGGEFLEVGAPTGFTGPFEIYVDDVLVGEIGPGEIHTFGDGVTKFRLMFVNDDPLDTADPDFATMFPTFLDFEGSPTSLRMSPVLVASADVPEPAAILLLAGGLLLVGVARRGRAAIAA